MSITTADAILNAAQECFFRHGYGATNIAMISRQAKISRVSIHKHFGTKEKLFRSMLSRHLEEVHETFPHYLAEYDTIWQTIESVLLDCGRPLFEGITDQWVLQELIQAGNDYCADIKEAHLNSLAEFLSTLFQKALDEKEISLTRLEFTPQELADTLVATTRGLYTTAPLEKIRIQLIRTLAICRAASLPE